MSKEIVVIVLGVWVMVVPYLGVPSSWKTVLFILSGFALVTIGFLLRSESLSRSGKRPDHQTFVENADTAFMTHPVHDRKEGINSLN